jgi:hypothetical protein
MKHAPLPADYFKFKRLADALPTMAEATQHFEDTHMKPTKLPTIDPGKLNRKQYMDGLRVVGYWAALYAIALVIVLMDCIVWRP